ncbi:hypothetical protein [Carboxylicivirga sp. N1Y90]|uniref:hypothetical protein n=1 Tax=Carboxylicivirga fragile TaxID=3417571 RepID=UPI003D3522F0|nr:hypothetical protein [Marinilabiliaceae bacterium N1Y90]
MKNVLVTIGIAVLVALTACNKNDNLLPEDQLNEVDLKTTTESVIVTEASLDDVTEAADYEVDLFTGSDIEVASAAFEASDLELKAGDQHKYRNRYRWGKCPDIHIVKEEGGYPRTITLNYGEGTELTNGRVIAGIIEIVMSGPRRENGATRTVTFIDFSVDDVAIAGTSIKTFLKDEYKVNIVRDMSFTLPEDGTVIERTAEKTRTWVAGMDTPFDHSDDVINITGYTNCEDSDGNSYNREITTALVKNGECRYIVAGEITLTKNGVEFGVINYGDGKCDNIATLTTAEGTKEFEIGKRHRQRKQDQNKDS